MLKVTQPISSRAWTVWPGACPGARVLTTMPFRPQFSPPRPLGLHWGPQCPLLSSPFKICLSVHAQKGTIVEAINFGRQSVTALTAPNCVLSSKDETSN